MYTLRLFHQDEPFREIEARDLGAGALSVGRDETADWPIADESRTLSRTHCVFAVEKDGVTVRDASANGVFLGQDRKRLAHDRPAPVTPGEPVRLGDYIILVEAAAAPLRVVEASAASSSADAPSGGALLEAFCQGAQLDSSAFSGEDPAEVMRRLGAVYQQMVAGLAALMTERTMAKTEYNLEKTTLRAGGNNPFRWATADRVAVDLLRPREDGFLSGAAAVQLSFGDLNKHLACTLAGAKASAAATLDALDPARFEAAAKGLNFALKNRSAEAWERYAEAHAGLRALPADDERNPATKAFREGYEAERDALEANRTVA